MTSTSRTEALQQWADVVVDPNNVILYPSRDETELLQVIAAAYVGGTVRSRNQNTLLQTIFDSL